MNHGELEILARFPGWEFFGTLTFAGRLGSERKCRAFAINYFWRVADSLRIPRSSLVWVLREEEGELGGRRHFHYLLGGTRNLPLTIAGCIILERIWTRIGRGRGFAKVKVYDKGLSGVAYVSKCLSSVVTTDGGASYEVRKFGSSQLPLVLSNSLTCRLERMMELRERRPYAVVPRRTSESRRVGVQAVGVRGSTMRRGSGDLPGHDAGQDEKSGERVLLTSMANLSTAPF